MSCATWICGRFSFHGGSVIRIRFSAKTDVGRRRKHNEDAFIYSVEDRFGLLADGMGGHEGGEVASKLACELLGGHLVRSIPKRAGRRRSDRGGASLRDMLPDLIVQWTQEANRIIFEQGDKQHNGKRMGTTLCILCVREDFAVLGHVGDSRIYRMRDGTFEPMTEDHSIRTEDLPPEVDRTTLTKKKYLTRTLGTRPKARPDIQIVDVDIGDRFLLCSDGLTDLVRDEEIGELLWEGEDLDEVCDGLVRLANKRGGKDNITVLLAEMRDEDETTEIQIEEALHAQ